MQTGAFFDIRRLRRTLRAVLPIVTWIGAAGASLLFIIAMSKLA